MVHRRSFRVAADLARIGVEIRREEDAGCKN